jgi:hypothetical protein
MTGLLLLLLTDVVETPHYFLYAPADVVQEYAKILEAAYPQFEKFFKKKRKITKGEKLVLHFDEKRPDKIPVLPLRSANVTYVPSTGVAYAHRERTSYTSRVHLLRAAATQFHWLATMRNERPASSWWDLGIPEYLAQHHWDGSTLTLGVKPVVGYGGDPPSLALLKTQGKQFDMFGFVGGLISDYSMSWAFCRFMLTGNQGKPFKGYDKWARKMDGGNPALVLFRKTYGRDKKLQAQFLPWLDAQQPQLEQVTGDWSPTGPNSVRAIAKKHGILRVRGKPTAVEATIVVPAKGRWIAGALVHYNNRDDYTVALLDWGGFIRIQRWMKTRWQMIERGQGPPKGKDGNYKLQIFRKKGKTYLMVGLDGYGPWDVPGDGIGLAIDRCDVRFKSITWK